MAFEKYARYILYALMGIAFILIVVFYIDVQRMDDPKPEPRITNFILQFSYFLFIIGVIATIGFSVMNLIGNPSMLKNVAIVVIVAAVLFVVSRILASDELLNLKGYDDNVPKTLKNVGTGLLGTYILLGASIVAILYAEINKLLK